MSSGADILASYHLPSPLPMWLNPNYAKHIVKGNFMTLSARPKTVEQGEWIAHHGMYSIPQDPTGHRELTGRFQLLNIIEISGILSACFTRRRMTEPPSAMPALAHECLLERRLPPSVCGVAVPIFALR